MALAFAQGDSLQARAGRTKDDIGNVAINVAQGETFFGNNIADASGTGNLAVNLGGTVDPVTKRINIVQAYGLGNTAFNIGGKGNWVSAGNSRLAGAVNESGIPQGTTSTAGSAFNIGGSNNTVSALGPFAIAGAIGKDGLNGPNRIVQFSPGININNL